MRQKVAELINIKEAMDNLAAIASINMESPTPIGIVKETRIVTNIEETESNEVRWLSGEGAESLLDVLDITYRAVYHHLQSLYDNPGMDWESKKSRDGVCAMMSLVGESAQKMNVYLSFRLDHPLATKVEQRESFRSLQRFYSERFAKKFIGGIEGKDAWESAWHEKHSLLEATGSELKDFESLLLDKEYELFYVANEEGVPYLSERLLRNLKLTVDFDIAGGSFEEDPFLKVKAMQDRDLQASASQILHECHGEIEQFYKNAKKLFQYALAKSLSHAILALFLASNSRHLLQRTVGKSCFQYFHDFHLFLRHVMKSAEYQKWISYPPAKSDVEANLLIMLTHKLCFAFFHRSSGIKQEAIGLIHRTMRRGEELQPKERLQRQETAWGQMLFDDEKFRTLLHKFPSGPLLKILDTVRHDQEEGVLIPFDPWIQSNLPSRLFTMESGKKKVDVLAFAAPIRQPMIHRVEIIDEFRGFLRHLASLGKGKKHLLINLQDRLSWRETARSTAIEDLAKNQSFATNLVVLTLPKDTDFYHQRNAFSDLTQASLFLSAFKEQLIHSEKNGFYFPAQWKKADLMKFTDVAFTKIHKYVFEQKTTLTRQMREDFIEIFYQMVVVEAMNCFGADSLSFTCKDGVDTGAYASGLFYGFLKSLEGNLQTKENLDFLRFLFYWRALSIRERAADPEQFLRSLSALETWSKALEMNGSKMVKEVDIDWTV